MRAHFFCCRSPSAFAVLFCETTIRVLCTAFSQSQRRLGRQEFSYICSCHWTSIRDDDDDIFSPMKTAKYCSAATTMYCDSRNFPLVPTNALFRGLSICQLSIRISEVMIHFFSRHTHRSLHFLLPESFFALFWCSFFSFTCGLFPKWPARQDFHMIFRARFFQPNQNHLASIAPNLDHFPFSTTG